MKENTEYIDIFNNSINSLFKDGLKITLKNPSLAGFFARTLISQKKAANKRRSWETKGIHVPPFIIISVTNRCNLNCKGCYTRNLRKPTDAEMSRNKLLSVIREAEELGVSIIMISGGEPLIRRDILETIKEFPNIIFPLFTNGMLINEETIKTFKAHKNIVPIISMEGYEEQTDKRRGKGIYENLTQIIKKISGKNIFFGCSLTIARSNYSVITNKIFVSDLISLGCKLFIYVEYVPIKKGTEGLVLRKDERINLLNTLKDYRAGFPGLFIAFPGEEDELKGCMSSGRGFVHISAEGNVEPCPFAPYSDANLNNLPLKEALQSEFLKKIRENHEQLSETEGGCALWAKRGWAASLLKKRL